MGIKEHIPSEEEFILFQRLVHDRLGISLPMHKRIMLGHRLIKRVKHINAPNFAKYYEHINLLEHAKELELALELLTTNETFFFREEKHFEYLSDELLPEISANKTLKVWSAACSTGEEPYSLAMLLQHHHSSPWQLMASDVNNSVLAHAKKGIYIDERTTLLPENYRKAYCVKGIDEFEGYLRVKSQLRNKVNFFNFNLLNDMKPLGKLDIIFIRNVMIYFDDDVRQKIITNITNILNPGGWLFISHSETLHGLEHSFELMGPAIYKLKT
jgi:chemotaxis protein methyltransferase CheR